MRTFTALMLALVSTLAGCTTHDHSSHEETCHGLQTAVAADDPNAMPDEIRTYLAKHHWGHMHLDFHIARMWDVLSPDTREWATGEGISRAELQEGAPTSGLEFLAMHRLMLDELRTGFPQHAALFIGWPEPPTDPRDAETPLPGGSMEAFDPTMLTALDRLGDARIGELASDDEFALYLQTKRRPTTDDPKATSPDRSAGLHNYLHNRFADDDSPITVGDPSVNLQNRVFWRIHGWVDSRWTAYRKAKGLDDATDVVYQKAMADAQVWMDEVMDRAVVQSSKADGCTEPAPDEIKHLFEE